MIEEFVNYIAANTVFTVGDDLFAISNDPDPVNTCVVIGEPAPGLANAYLTDLRFIPLVAYSRAPTRFTARDNAYIVFNLLHGKDQITLGPIEAGDTYIVNVECRTPYYISLDESRRRHIFSMPIEVTMTNIL